MKKLYLLLVHIVIFYTHSCGGAKILGIISVPFHSHVIPLGTYFKSLAQRGHNVTILTAKKIEDPPNNLEQIEFAGTIEMLKQNPVLNGRNKYLQGNYYLDIFYKLTEFQIESKNFQQFIRRNYSYDLLVVQQIYSYAFLGLAHHFGSPPVIGISTVGTLEHHMWQMGNPLQFPIEPFFPTKLKFPMNFLQRIQNAFYIIQHNYFTDYNWRKHDKLMRKHFGDDLPPVETLAQNLSLLLNYYNEITDNVVAQMPGIINIGGLHIGHTKQISLSQDIKIFLDSSKNGFIYVSLGSNYHWKVFDKNLREYFIEALVKTGLPVLWKDEDSEIEKKSNKFRIDPWLPQETILGHPNIRLFVSQGGLQSTQEAVYYGVPLLGIPIVYDQFKDINNLESKGAALGIDSQQDDSVIVEQKIQRILNDPSFRDNAKKISKFFRDRPMAPLETAVWWTEFVLRNNGAQYFRSPLIDLPWIIKYSIDIILFNITLCLIFIYINIKISKKFIKYVKNISFIKTKIA